jgi:putative ABC transport system ATP-binding protein
MCKDVSGEWSLEVPVTPTAWQADHEQRRREPMSTIDTPPVAATTLSEHTVRSIDVKRVYKMGNEEVHALKGITVSINRGEYISIMGPSGSGKSTFFNMIGGLDKPSSGKVYIDEVDIAQLDSYELAWMRCHKIGYIFQTFNLLTVQTALENVMLPMIFAGVNTSEAQDRAAEILKRVELGHRLFNKPGEMSGGQQQRVAIARAFANDPAIILADEPTGNLDLNTGTLIIKLLRDLNKEKGVTIISATHDHKMLAVSDRIIWIRDGKVDKIQNREDLKIEVGTIEGLGGEDAH